VKSNAIDCVFNAPQNKPLEHGYSCFSYPINQNPKDLAYLPDFQEDKKTTSFGMKERSRKIKGKVILKDGVKYVILNDDTSVLYDYPAYLSAGVLVEAF